MNDKANSRAALPAEVSEVALLDINAVCKAHGMSASWVHGEVREGRAPQPLRFGPRCTRWSATTVRAWLIERAEQGANDAASAALVKARATKASNAAKAKRLAEALPA